MFKVVISMQGVSSREEVKRKILLFVADGKGHNRSEFPHAIDASKNTVYKYLDQLVDEDKMIDVRPGSREDFFRPIYRINDCGLEKVERINLQDRFINWLDDPFKRSLIFVLASLMEIDRDRYAKPFYVEIGSHDGKKGKRIKIDKDGRVREV